MQIDNITGLMN